MEELMNYVISHETMALEQIYHPDFNLKIYDVNGVFYIRQPVKQLIEDACLRRCSDSRGRLVAVRKAFPYQDLTPLVFCPDEQLIAFPTTDPANHDCKWIFPHHIDKHIIEKRTPYVVFKNGLKMELNCSYQTFQTQQERSSNILHHFSPPPQTMQLVLWKRSKKRS